MARSAWRMSGYRVEELLGAGASGEVWRGRVPSTGVAVALKRVWLSDPVQRRTALSEAAMLSALDHPHLMRLHEVRHVGDDAIVLVLDLAGGGSLGALLARRGRLTVGETITAIAPIGAALAYAHHSGVVHGDVSAANVLFTDIGLPLLADLGVARLLGDRAPVRTTPAYADPAVVTGGLPGPDSDVFMLGGVALHALTGMPPWPGTDPSEVLEAAAAGEQPDFAGRLAAAGVPDPVAAIVARALSVDPSWRGTAADFALDLRHAGEPVAVELSAGRPRGVSPGPGVADGRGVAGGRGIVAGRGVTGGEGSAQRAGAVQRAGSVAPSGASGASMRVSSWPLQSVPVGTAGSGAEGRGVAGGGAAGGGAAARGAVTGGAADEHVPVVPFVGEQPLTSGVRAPSPFAMPPSSAARHLAGGRTRVTAGFAVAAVLLAAMIAASIWWWPFRGGDGHHRSSVAGASAPTSAVGRPSATARVSDRPSGTARASGTARPSGTARVSGTARPSDTTPTSGTAPRSSSSVSPKRLDSAGAQGVLAALDSARAAAFATRDPARLAAVYASAPLLARDRAMLLSIVPSGCGLHGVHTTFAAVTVVRQSGDQVQVQANATVGGSTLVCAGSTSGRAPAGATTRLVIDLVRRGPGYVIAAQQRA